MKNTYLCISRIRVEGANAFSSGVTVNPAPVSAAVLFGHALSRQLEEPIAGVAYLHHDAQLLGEKFYTDFHPQQRRGASFIDKNDYASTNKNALSLQPTASCHLTISLIFELEEDAEVDLEIVRNYLRGGRFAGGKIVDFANIDMLDPDSPLAELPGGFWLVDRSDLLADSHDHLKSITDILSRPKDDPAYQSWLVLTGVGYAAITDAAHRDYVREGYSHFFSEPMMGLVQFVSRRKYEDGQSSPPFWRMSWPNPKQFLIHQL